MPNSACQIWSPTPDRKKSPMPMSATPYPMGIAASPERPSWMLRRMHQRIQAAVTKNPP